MGSVALLIENKEVHKYKDVHVNRIDAMRWLKNEAVQYRGRKERFNNVNR